VLLFRACKSFRQACDRQQTRPGESHEEDRKEIAPAGVPAAEGESAP
jgi:hypothetical protein